MSQVYSNIEVKVKGFLRTALSAEASTATIDVDFIKEDDVSTSVTLQSDTLMFEIDPLGKTGKVSELCLATSNAADTPSTGRTRFSTVTRGLTREGHEQTGSAARANSWDAGTEVAIATGSMAKMVNLLSKEVALIAENNGVSLQLPVYADATARDAAITSPSNGELVYQTDEGTVMQFIGGAWANNATGTVVNASNTVAGKVDIATAAEIGDGTAADATSGAINVIPVSQTAKTSSGAADENFLPVLNAAGDLADGFISETSVLQHFSKPFVAGENLTAGNAIRTKIDGLAYNAQKYPVVGRLNLISATNDSSTSANSSLCIADTNKFITTQHTAAASSSNCLLVDGEKVIASVGGNLVGNNGLGYTDSCNCGTDKFAVVQWNDAAVGVDDGEAQICTVATATVTAGSTLAFEAGTQIAGSVNRVCSTGDDKIVVAWEVADTSSTCNVRCGTIATRTITFGAEAVVSSDANSGKSCDIINIDTDKFVVAYAGAGSDLFATVGTIDTRTITLGDTVELHDAITILNNSVRVAKLATDKFLVTYYNSGDATSYMVVCTVSGTVITPGTPVAISGFIVNNPLEIVYFSDNKVALVGTNDYYYGTASYGIPRITFGWVVVNGTVPTFTPTNIGWQIESVNSETFLYSFGIEKLNNDQVVIGIMNLTSSDHHYALIADNNFIGFADSTVSTSDPINVNTVIDDNQTSLLPGIKYYLGADGALSSSGYLEAGTALSATEILKK